MPLFKPNLTTLKNKRDVAGLIQALKTKDARLRRDALKALGDLGDPRALDAVVQALLADEKELGDKVYAAEALGKLGAAAAIEPLMRAYETSQRREQETIAAILASPDRRYRDNFYVNRISTDELELRTTIAQALAQIGGTAALHALLTLLATEQGAMETSIKNKLRGAIQEVARKLGNAAVPIFCEQLRHPLMHVREWAAHCLGEFEDGPAIQQLVRVAMNEDETFDVRIAALNSLGQIGNHDALAYIEELIHSPNRVIARDAKQCVTTIRTRLGLPRLPGF